MWANFSSCISIYPDSWKHDREQGCLWLTRTSDLIHMWVYPYIQNLEITVSQMGTILKVLKFYFTRSITIEIIIAFASYLFGFLIVCFEAIKTVRKNYKNRSFPYLEGHIFNIIPYHLWIFKNPDLLTKLWNHGTSIKVSSL